MTVSFEIEDFELGIERTDFESLNDEHADEIQWYMIRNFLENLDDDSVIAELIENEDDEIITKISGLPDDIANIIIDYNNDIYNSKVEELNQSEDTLYDNSHEEIDQYVSGFWDRNYFNKEIYPRLQELMSGLNDMGFDMEYIINHNNLDACLMYQHMSNIIDCNKIFEQIKKIIL